jgi:hypothetical protein
MPLSFVFPERDTIISSEFNENFGYSKNFDKNTPKKQYYKAATSTTKTNYVSKSRPLEYSLPKIDTIIPSAFFGHAIFKEHNLFPFLKNKSHQKSIGNHFNWYNVKIKKVVNSKNRKFL